ncbi:MAG: aldehyde dehydrogenase family protein [Jatrophihabitans sp.]|uniref:aldehyde dehydrogenase family protein n=1 Tax=Jatrophihabitans sp. TaxID=1932789 RepID=UPI003F81920A
MTALDARPTTTFDSLNPATGEVVASFPIDDADSVRAAVERARPAAIWWREQGFEGRKKYLRAWRSLMARRIDEFADLIHRENGKPKVDALLELSLAIEHLDWASGAAKKVLGRHRVGSGVFAANQWASVEYLPYGVVGAIGPWNYPVYTPLGTISYALAAGNAVVFKPSEYTPAIGKWLVDSFAEIVDQPVFQLVTGFGETGAALCTAGVDKVAFTGSTATGKKIMAACADRLTPVVIECGGKDALIVAADADLDAAADAAVFGGLSNAGQTCAGVERIYAVASVYDEFVAKVAEKARALRAGGDDGASYGPITMPGQLDIIRRHIEDAIARGGTAVVGGVESVQAPFVQPVILTDVPEDSAAVQEETFGPTITVKKVRDEREAIELANDSRYGLGASVWSAKRGREIADQLSCGCVAINSVLSFAMVPQLPFGGVRDSGFGRIHGADGLREFAWPRSVTSTRFPTPLKLATFDRPANASTTVTRLVRALYGRTRK